ncbi:MAG: ABC transporter permease [Elusimicrobiota bacterium]
MLLRLAWRNLWRNRRRSLLTVSSIAVGLAAVMFGQSLIRSFQRQMIEKSTGVMLGHVQVQAAGVQNRRIPEKLLSNPERFREILAADPRVAAVGSRLLYTGLVYSAVGSRGVLVVGVEPDAERDISILPGYLTDGRYLGESKRDIFLGDKLAGDLDVRLGERLVVMAQSGDGEMNSELFRVAGVYHTGSTAYDGQIVYVPIEAARGIRGLSGEASHVVARLDDVRKAGRLSADLRAKLDDPSVVALTYRDVGSEVVGIKKFQDGLLVVILIVIFAIVGLGILNSISMSFFERIREFGVLRAIGARPALVRRVLLAEAALMGLIGTCLGFAAGLGLIWAFGTWGLELPVGKAMSYFIPFEDVIYMRPVWGMHLWSALGVFCVCLAASVGPAARGSRLVVTAALRHV